MNQPSGRALGGIARAQQMSDQEKKQRAKNAAAARWENGDVRKVTHGSDDHPLMIGDIQIPCYVLEDETRVISQRGIQGGIGMSSSGSRAGDQRLAVFMDGLTQRGVDTKGLADRIRNPIKFSLGRGRTVYGYEATILADICDVILAARKTQGALLPSQVHFAERCELLIRGFARIGIIALIDEATGYQKDRTKDALARILDAFIATELQPWLRTFPSDFYQEMFRLRGLGYDPKNVKRPQYFGGLTNNVVYDRLAPGVRDELQRGVPRNEAGRPTAKYFQKLTQHTGYPKLREHLGSVVTLMKLSEKWEDFIQKMDRIHPKYNETIQLPLEYKNEPDDGKGL